jgi:hypothetical protein
MHENKTYYLVMENIKLMNYKNKITSWKIAAFTVPIELLTLVPIYLLLSTLRIDKLLFGSSSFGTSFGIVMMGMIISVTLLGLVSLVVLVLSARRAKTSFRSFGEL